MIRYKFCVFVCSICFLGVLLSCTGTETVQPTSIEPPTIPPTTVQQDTQQGEVQTTTVPEEKPAEIQIRAKDGMTMVRIPAGSFPMGSTETQIEDALALCQEHYHICNRWYYQREDPQHLVSLDAFWMDQTEISNAQYRLCVEAGVCAAPLTCKKGEPTFNDPEKADHPVVCIAWAEAQNYCQWTGAQLPTEAQWEYAYRGEKGSIYPWGDDFDGTRLNYCDRSCSQSHADQRFDDGYALTAPVGSYPQGASWAGLFNMSGNVAEWVSDWLGDYAPEAQSNPSGPSNGGEKMLKGGSWFGHPTYSRAAIRPSVNPDTRFDYLGFRCASSHPPVSAAKPDVQITPSATIESQITEKTDSQQAGVPEEVDLVFATAGEFEAARSWDVALGDLDGDGDLDAVTSDDDSAGMKLWFNDGSGLFELGDQRFDPGLRIVLGDLDDDDDLDIVATHWDTETDDWLDGHRDAAVWLNDGSGYFSKGQDGIGGELLFNLALGDLNGDGPLDLFFTGVDSDRVWLNDGTGHFTDTGQRLETGVDAAVALGDLDGDGDLDALTGGWEGPAQVWLNDGMGIFASQGTDMTGSSLHIHGIVLGDLDADGDLDAFAVLANGGPHEIWLNDGTGSFDVSQKLSAPLGQGVVLGDIDFDRDLDAVSAHGHRSGGHLRIWLNDGSGTFSDSQLKLGDTFSADLALGDLDNDGDLDILAAHTGWQFRGRGEVDIVWLNGLVTSSKSAAALGDSMIRASDAMKMFFVPAGRFLMGSDESDLDATTAELPEHQVLLDGFWIDETEVTNAQYNLCVGAEKCAESRYVDNSAYNGDDYPAVGVNWQSAGDYCAWVGGRLPTEAQWEYVAKGPDGLHYPWGNEFDGSLVNFCDANCEETWADQSVEDGFEESAPAGSYPGGASWVGALDMAGNVWEWTWDWCASYEAGPQINPTGPAEGNCKIIRGGAWASPADGIRTTYRIIGTAELSPDIRHPNIGFRCVVPASQEIVEGAEMDEIVVPEGVPPEIDGTMAPGEWDAARVETFADGSELYLMEAGGELYVGIRSNTPGMIAGNVFIHQDGQIKILHSSAALGTAIYVQGDGVWEQTQDFSWRCRSTSSSESAQAERDQFLQEEGWLAANSRIGMPNELEYRIKKPGQSLHLAVNFLRASDTSQKIPWPAHLDDDCIKLTPRGYPKEMQFSPAQWGVLTLK